MDELLAPLAQRGTAHAEFARDPFVEGIHEVMTRMHSSPGFWAEAPGLAKRVLM